MLTIEAAIQGRRNNFTLFRLIAAIVVLFAHSYALSLGKGNKDPITQFLVPIWGAGAGTVAVDLFFVISGFLITASYLHRENIFAFSEARVLRIYPALLVAMGISVFIIGLAATTMPVKIFLSQEATWTYFFKNSSLIFGIQPGLPGVFQNNPYPNGVNGSLWTLPIEMTMYFWVALLGLSSILGNRSAFNLFVLGVVLLYIVSGPGIFIGTGYKERFPLMFLFGAILYVNRTKVILDYRIIAGLAVLMWVMKSHGKYYEISQYAFFAYLVIYVSLHPKIILPSMDKYGDYSYGIYIYAFPVQQACALWIPNLTPFTMFLSAMLFTVPLALLSWRYIEKPALKMKGKMRFGIRWTDQRVSMDN